jgi:hypothetical protein
MSAILKSQPFDPLISSSDANSEENEQPGFISTASIVSNVVENAQPLSPIGSTASAIESSSLLSVQPSPVRDLPSLRDVNTVLNKKKSNRQLALNDTWTRYSPSMIGGDLFTMVYTGFTGAQYFAPSLQSISCLGWITSGAAEIGGLINILVACQEIKEAFTAQGNDNVTFWKNVFDASLYILIGLLMITIGIATKVIALGSLAAFFTANPWLLPVLFFVASLPLIVEVSHRVTKIVLKKNLASCIAFQSIKTNLLSNRSEALHTLQASLFSDLSSQSSTLDISKKMEKLQEDMGVEAAIEVFSLFKMLMDESVATLRIEEQIQRAEQKIKEWYRAQYVRMFQQVLYIMAFVISMGALAPGVNANVMKGSDNVAMAGANLIPLYMDTFWPFKRNVQMVVPPAI